MRFSWNNCVSQHFKWKTNVTLRSNPELHNSEFRDFAPLWSTTHVLLQDNKLTSWKFLIELHFCRVCPRNSQSRLANSFHSKKIQRSWALHSWSWGYVPIAAPSVRRASPASLFSRTRCFLTPPWDAFVFYLPVKWTLLQTIAPQLFDRGTFFVWFLNLASKNSDWKWFHSNGEDNQLFLNCSTVPARSGEEKCFFVLFLQFIENIFSKSNFTACDADLLSQARNQTECQRVNYQPKQTGEMVFLILSKGHLGSSHKIQNERGKLFQTKWKELCNDFGFVLQCYVPRCNHLLTLRWSFPTSRLEPPQVCFFPKVVVSNIHWFQCDSLLGKTNREMTGVSIFSRVKLCRAWKYPPDAPSGLRRIGTAFIKTSLLQSFCLFDFLSNRLRVFLSKFRKSKFWVVCFGARLAVQSRDHQRERNFLLNNDNFWCFHIYDKQVLFQATATGIFLAVLLSLNQEQSRLLAERNVVGSRWTVLIEEPDRGPQAPEQSSFDTRNDLTLYFNLRTGARDQKSPKTTANVRDISYRWVPGFPISQLRQFVIWIRDDYLPPTHGALQTIPWLPSRLGSDSQINVPLLPSSESHKT